MSYPMGQGDHGLRYEVAVEEETGLRVYCETDDLKNAEANARNMMGPAFVWDTKDREFVGSAP